MALTYAPVGIVVVLAQHPFGLWDKLGAVDPGTQRAVFGSTAGAMALLGGFIISTTFTFASTGDNETLEDFRREHGRQTSYALLTAFLITVTSVGLTLAAMLAAPSAVSGYLYSTACLLVLLHVVRVAAIAWTLLMARYGEDLRTPLPYLRTEDRPQPTPHGKRERTRSAA